MNVLFVCTQNRCRSVTAERLYAGNPDHEVKSAGTGKDAQVQVSRELLLWADRVFVFEKVHRNSIHKRFPDLYANLKIECLYIEDLYEPMDPLLVRLLTLSLLKHLGTPRGGAD